jgi:branched-chain amino acid transport system permease protein
MSRDDTRRSAVLKLAGGAGLVALMACLPLLNIVVPGVLPGATYTPGTLHLLALAMLTAAVALSYHLLLGVAGLLSFGHALYFGAGVYGLGVILEQWEIPLLPAMGLALVLVIVLANVLGAISLRVTGIPFAMVTLSFAQAGNVLARRDPGDLTGGEEGLSLNTDVVPDWLVGVSDTRNLYWLALAALVVTYLLVTWVQSSRAGHVAEATRENELRVRVLGMRPYVVKLVLFVAAATIAGGVGMIYLLLQNNAVPHVLSADFTITLLLMVVLGGVGSRWGAIAGAVVYTLLVQRLTVLASSDAVAGLPAVLRIPLSEPMFILGTLFVLVVLFLPGGIAGGVATVQRRRGRGRDRELPGTGPGRQDVEHPLEDVVTEPR